MLNSKSKKKISFGNVHVLPALALSDAAAPASLSPWPVISVVRFPCPNLNYIAQEPRMSGCHAGSNLSADLGCWAPSRLMQSIPVQAT